MKKLFYLCILITIFSYSKSFAQKDLESKDFKEFNTYFKLSKNHEIVGKTRKKLKKILSEAQFVGLAEVHQSQQLSYFTKGFLELLSEDCFKDFALEMGPYSAQILQNISSTSVNTSKKIQALNHKYGKNDFPKIPLIFADKKEDAIFIETASERTFKFWGLDQEFEYSYVMLLDNIYNQVKNKTSEIKNLYLKSKKVLSDVNFQYKKDGIVKNCWLIENDIIQKFFNKIDYDENIKNYIDALKITWDIYCKASSGKNSNQQRADYMKSNFEKMYKKASKTKQLPKVFIKLGSLHLTHTTSPLGVNDIGKYIHDKAQNNGSKFLSFYHLTRFKDGKDLIHTKEWKNTALVLSLEKKNKWTLIDLRPIRKRINSGELKTTDIIAYGVNAYDFALISPDDTNGKLNY